MKASTDLHRQLVWDRLLAVVEEQAQTLMRTAFSTVVREAGDLSAGVFDTKGQMIAQAVTGTPGHVNAMAASVSHFLDRFPLSTLQADDALMTNDPWLATGHLNDFTVVSPVYYRNQALRCLRRQAISQTSVGVGLDRTLTMYLKRVFAFHPCTCLNRVCETMRC